MIFVITLLEKPIKLPQIVRGRCTNNHNENNKIFVPIQKRS